MLRNKSQKILNCRLKLLKLKDEMQDIFLDIANLVEEHNLNKSDKGSVVYCDLGQSIEVVYKNIIAAEDQLDLSFKFIRELSNIKNQKRDTQ